MTTALLLIDIQKDYFEFGAMQLVNADACATKDLEFAGQTVFANEVQKSF